MARRNPPAIPADTSPEAWRVQMAAIGRRSAAENLQDWESLNRELGRMEAAAVRHRHPDYGEREVLLAVARRRYGDDLVGAAWPEDDLVEP